MRSQAILAFSSLLTLFPEAAHAVAGAPFVNMPTVHTSSSEIIPHLFIFTVIIGLIAYLAIVLNAKH